MKYTMLYMYKEESDESDIHSDIKPKPSAACNICNIYRPYCKHTQTNRYI